MGGFLTKKTKLRNEIERERTVQREIIRSTFVIPQYQDEEFFRVSSRTWQPAQYQNREIFRTSRRTLEDPQYHVVDRPSGSNVPQISAPKIQHNTTQQATKRPLYQDCENVKTSENTLEFLQHKGCNEAELLSRIEQIPMSLALNFICLLLEGCTLPFIARYRKSAVDFLMPNRLQELYQSYIKISQFKKKVNNVIETLRKSNKLTTAIEENIYKARNSAELDLICTPLLSPSLSAAEKARKLGLEPHAVCALNGEYVDIEKLCTRSEELCTVVKVKFHMTHIIADIIFKDARVLQKLWRLKEETCFTIQSRQTASSTKRKDENIKISSKSDPDTYQLYFDWQSSSNVIKSYQTLAINRGENENILSVKVIVPDSFYNKLEMYCLTLWKSKEWVHKGLGDAYNRLIKPWLSRQVRKDLTTVAHKEAVKTFTTNLEKYLLTEPIKNKIIAGLDPGFKAGCKIGIINSNGDKLTTYTIYPYLNQRNSTDRAAAQLKYLLAKYKVDLIGLGNGTACRETESWLKYHRISDNIPIIIVPEQGASIYSVSKEAQQEHPNMDPNVISALSIARRVLDPLGELIKVEPKNLGVGLYQHDIPGKMLESALECTIEKVISLVGVDVNTASHAMLRRISGLNEAIAGNIIRYRQNNGGFSERTELYDVGIDRKTFQQCAGFLRVLGGYEPLDATIIHPESYMIAKLFAMKIGVNINEITQPHFPNMVESKITFIDLNRMSKTLDTDISTLELIINAFKQKTYEDNTITFCRPVYSVQAVDQVQEGTTLTGVVRNVVPFGCFVDCGLGDDGLIHTKNMGRNSIPKLGDRVVVIVIPSIKPKKIQFKLVKIID